MWRSLQTSFGLVAVGASPCLDFPARTRPRYTACRSGEMACPGRRVRKETPSSSEGACCRGKAGAFSVVSKADVTSSGILNLTASQISAQISGEIARTCRTSRQQSLAEIPAAPGQLERYDYEYKRNGTANVFMMLDVHRPWRKAKVTERRAAEDYAHCMRELVDVHYPDAEYVRVVQDNLSTHSAGALYNTFPPAEARRILRRLEFHYTPKHASWLNMVEIEIGVLRGQYLDRRIESYERIESEIAAWERQRNASGARIEWKFTTDKARAKMGRAYPQPASLRQG